MARLKIGIVACGVLEWNIKKVIQQIQDVEFHVHILPAQLHENPGRLRQLLQEKIDELEAGTGLDGIVIAYGLCGRGTVGLFSRELPLVLPRTQDCIGIYLGSHVRHMQEFSQKPGTRYMTQGWYEKTVKPSAQKSFLSRRDHSLYGHSFEELAERYGEENAAYICTFRESWKKNYQRAAYIKFEEEDAPPGQQFTQGLAKTLDWDHEILDGDSSLLFSLLNGDWNDPRILVVPPQSKTVSAPGDEILAFASGIDSRIENLLGRYQQQSNSGRPSRSGLGLGIDTGGTFTDAVIFDFDSNKILAAAKARTTHHNLVEGIITVLKELPQAELQKVGRVGLSTTLATNAFVEHKGRPVALLLMSPLPLKNVRLPFRFVHRVQGAISIDGEEQQAVDPAEVRRFASQAVAAGCEAFAVSGFGSVMNPAHELAVAKIAFEETGLHAVCGHELTSELNFVERATTAAMNAKLIPLIERLLTAVKAALAAQGLAEVKIMVVKGDGSQILDDVARAFPVETVLSGPAASVIGAAQLFQHKDAVVADMGGTTLDVALLQGHAPVLSDSGACVGGFQTSVRAMSVHTVGLGGDSEIDLSQWPKIEIGPRRVLPLCQFPSEYPDHVSTLTANIADTLTFARNCVDIVAALDSDGAANGILQHLQKEPRFLGRLARDMNRPNAAFINWRDLETEGKLQRYALTLTDILHYEGRYTAFDSEFAAVFVRSWAMLLDVDPEELTSAIYQEFRRMVADVILEAVLPDSCPWQDSGQLREWLTAHFAGGIKSPSLAIKSELNLPIIAVGAPVAVLFPQLAEVFHQDILISEHAGVANAVGAVAGDVLLRESASIKINSEGSFACSWRGGASRTGNLQTALETCESALTTIIRNEAKANQISFSEPQFSAAQHEAESRDGAIFLGVTLTGELRG